MAKMRTLTSMELSDDESLDAIMPIPMDKPNFPFTLKCALTTPEFEKLGIDPHDAKKGDIFGGEFSAEITDVLHRDGSDGPSSRVEFQITHLCVDADD